MHSKYLPINPALVGPECTTAFLNVHAQSVDTPDAIVCCSSASTTTTALETEHSSFFRFVKAGTELCATKVRVSNDSNYYNSATADRGSG